MPTYDEVNAHLALVAALERENARLRRVEAAAQALDDGVGLSYDTISGVLESMQYVDTDDFLALRAALSAASPTSDQSIGVDGA